MARDNKEIEIKVQVADAQPLLLFLKEKGTFVSEDRQVDEYFSPTKNSFLNERPVKEWLRLREVGGTFSITYKNWHHEKNGQSNYCDEFETKVSDGLQLGKILEALAFKSIAIVDKKRQLWRYKEYEIAIDHVAKLGEFIEIEYSGKDSAVDPQKTAEAMINFLKQVGCKNIVRDVQGYPFLILFPEEARSVAQ
jgi:predicted adenylyl cyclase CyaB